MIFKARKMRPNSSEDVLPPLATSNVISNFMYCFKNSYNWRTIQRQGSRIRQHVPKNAEDLFDSWFNTDAATYNKVYSPKSIGLLVVGDIKAPAGKWKLRFKVY